MVTTSYLSICDCHLICYLKAGYLPRAFMEAVVVPLVKCKTGNLAHINNYRAIAISTALLKLFESVIAKQAFTYDDCYQLSAINITYMLSNSIRPTPRRERLISECIILNFPPDLLLSLTVMFYSYALSATAMFYFIVYRLYLSLYDLPFYYNCNEWPNHKYQHHL